MQIRAKKINSMPADYTVFIFFIILLSICGCGSNSSDKPSSGDGSIALRVQFKGGTQKSAAAPPTQLDCTDLNLATIQAKVYDQAGGLVTSSDLWPCEEHHGTVNDVKVGSNYTVVILGKMTDQESDPVIIHGQRQDVTVRNGEASQIDIEAQTFVPKPTGMSGTCDNIILKWDTVPGAQNYEFTISENSDMSSPSVHTTAEISFAPQDLDKNATYFWQVKALDAYGNVSSSSDIGNITPGGPHLVKDISAGTLSSEPTLMVVINDILYFAARDETGQHLWRYDGTQPEKIVFSQSKYTYIQQIIEYQQDVYFSAGDGTDEEIWKVDGDTAYKIDIDSTGSSDPYYLTVFDRYLYFAASNRENDTEDRELYKFGGSDWTKIDINPSGSSSPRSLLVVGAALYFEARSEGGNELFKWDGQTLTAFDIDTSGSSYPHSLTAVNNHLYFNADDGSDRELYMHDGQTEQPIKIDVCKGTCSGAPTFLTGFDGALYFSATDEQGDRDLFMYPGTGTEIVNLNINTSGSSSPYNITNIDGRLYFSAHFDNIGQEPYYYSESQDSIIDDIQSGRMDSNPIEFSGLKDRIYFVAEDSPQYGVELWSALKTSHETSILDICPGSCSSKPRNLTVTEFNGESTLFFSADNGRNGRELWKITSTGTPRIVDINKAAGGVSPYGITKANGMLYFGADDGENGIELWESDGTAKATRMVADINPTGDSLPSKFTGFNNKLYFTADAEDEIRKLYEYDGNITSVIEIEGDESYRFGDMVASGGKLYISVSRQTDGGLWKYDGKKLPTKLLHSTLPDDYYVTALADANDALYFTAIDKAGMTNTLYYYNGKLLIKIDGNSPDQLTPIGDDLFFSASDENQEAHLYHYNGETPNIIKTNQNGESLPRNLTESEGKLYFSASDGRQRNPYVYDNGTLSKIEVDPGSEYEITDLFAADGIFLIFVSTYDSDNDTREFQLWQSDGASQAAKKIKVLCKDITTKSLITLQSIVKLNGKTYFSLFMNEKADDSERPTIAEIWETDGTTQNTFMMFEASDNSMPYFRPELLTKDGTLYYIFYDRYSGPDLWRHCPQ